MLHIVICDDDLSCLKQLSACVRDFSLQRGIEIELSTFDSADMLLKNYPKECDLIFLDIAMPGVDGMAAAREIRRFDAGVCIIFITTMFQRAIEGYAVRASGFIMKPINRTEIEHELNYAVTQIENNRRREQFLSIKIGGMLQRIPVSHISYLEVKNHQIEMMLDDKLYRYRNSITELEKELSGLGFFRCHSSFIINGEHISRIEQMRVILKNGRAIPISQRRRKRFMAEITDFLGKRI